MNVYRHAAVFGSSGGIGNALAAALERSGAQVTRLSRTGGDIAFDLEDPASIAAAAEVLRSDPPQLVLVATGSLSLPGGTGPERTYKAIDGDAMAQAFRLNAIGPALIARSTLPLFPRDQRCMFAALSARVGSIGDNRVGGWHSYRASKAALNMLIRNLAIELARSHPQAIVCGLHPGTVDTPLSEPFQANLPAGQVTAPDNAAAHLLRVLAALDPQDSGGVFDWRGKRVPD